MSNQRVRYFAYGSNMDVDQLKGLCPSAEVLGAGVLKGYRLGFTIYSSGWGGGAADVVPEPGREVWGIAYVMDTKDLDQLDSKEGCPDHYGRVELLVHVSGTEYRDVWVYEAAQKRSFVPPKRQYIKIMIRAAIRYGFPQEYVDSLSAVDCID